MEEVTTVLIPSATNLSDGGGGSEGGEWWSNEDVVSALRLDGGEGGLWTGNFVPPPPRPLFLDDSATPDGLTTCDLCTWAWQESKSFTLDAALEAPGELGWVLTLVIVSLISAVIGAIVMIVALHCKRMKTTGSNDNELTQRSLRHRNRPPISTPDDKSLAALDRSSAGTLSSSANGVWSWLSRRSTASPSPLASPTSPAENHYTNMDETYSGVVGGGEALYAELDRDSTDASPAYQNSAYADPDAPVSSAPSSAYYSDLSVTTTPTERAYEVVGLATLPVWEAPRLASISESVSVPSDYV